MDDAKSILLVRLSSLGDVILALFACHALKGSFPDLKVEWVCESRIKDLLGLCGFIDRVIEFPKHEITGGVKERRFLSVIEITRKFLKDLRRENYDITIDLHGNLKSAIVSSLARSRRLIGFSKPYSKEGSHLFYREKITGPPHIHKIERFMLPMRYLGVNGSPRDFDIDVRKEDLRYIERFLGSLNISGPIIAINPFSSRKGMYKRWPLESYRALIGKIISQTPFKVIILWGSTDEEEEAQSLAKYFPHGVYTSCKTSIPELIALLSKVDLHIAGDTASSHLCSLLKKPQVVIFGPSDHRINAPVGKWTVVLRKDVGCNPCKVRDCRERKCLIAVSPEEVFERAMSILEESKRG